ncbi:MAG: hypothetical protein WEE66_12685 [Actinomycetota bacterium]
MRTTPRDATIDNDGQAGVTPPVVGLLPDRRRRIGTLAFLGAISVVVWLIVANAGSGGPGRSPVTASEAPLPGSSALAPGTYRLPGMSEAVSVTLPDGWFAGDSIWGPAGQGVAAVSIGRPGASTSLAVFDLDQLRPFGTSSNRPLERSGDRAWYARSLEAYRARVEPRLRDRVLGRQLDWRPPPVLAWLLTHTDRRPIEMTVGVAIGGRLGDLVSFSFPGPTRPVFDVPRAGTIALRPGVSYTFWVPTERDRLGSSFMVGIARELGAVVGTAEWDVIRTLELGE